MKPETHDRLNNIAEIITFFIIYGGIFLFLCYPCL